MTHSYRIHYFHIIWSTKGRLSLITPEIQLRLYPYIGGIIAKHDAKLIEIGGMPDHVHLLIKLNSLDNFSAFIRDIKASSSLWLHKNFPQLNIFAWQEGYGSFSVSYSTLETVQSYIQNQERHHSTMSFDQEYIKLLKLHHETYDERFVLG